VNALKVLSGRKYEVANLTHAECIAASKRIEVVAIIDLKATMSDKHTVYEGGVARQVQLERHLLDEVVEMVGAAQPFDRHLGHMS